jgi:hypothetical protein
MDASWWHGRSPAARVQERTDKVNDATSDEEIDSRRAQSTDKK